jgi:tol-pal system protein YbgF
VTLRVGLALSVVVVSACITVPEFRALEREVGELKRTQAAGPEGSPAAGARLADLGAEVESLEREVARLRGAVEEAQYAADEAHRIAEEARQAATQPQQGAGAPALTAPAPLPGAPVTTLTQEVRDYEKAFGMYRDESFQNAIDRFRTFLQNYPSSDYADNALFWIGECQFRLGEYERAVLTFEDVVKEYPDGNKVPDALYRQGVALLEIGKKNNEENIYRPAAREIFERIVRDYPGSVRVPEAQKQLEKLSL